MNALQDRRVQVAIGAVVAILLALLLAVFMLRQPKPSSKDQQVAVDKGALQVDLGEGKVSQTKPLRCFVNGQYVGDFAVAECAKRNGVAAQALDVGLDPATGQVAAGGGTTAPLQPLPAPTSSASPAPAAPELAEGSPPPGNVGDCLRYSGGEWRGAGQGLSLGQCVRVLFDGRCVRPGDALYGRSGTQTVRLLPGRVEVSPDNRSFRTLVSQDQDCALPAG